jgi:hypothetical protein
MQIPKEIKLGLDGNLVKPHQSDHTRDAVTGAKIGDVLIFTADDGLQVQSLNFPAASPFGSAAVGYGVNLTVAPSTPPGRYRYHCRVIGPDGKPHDDGGGEIEISI